jgi:ferritin-like metal-binding protein YciE
MASNGETLLEWLRDAHALERRGEHALRNQTERIVNYPDVRTRVKRNLYETLEQKRLLEGCIVRLGGRPSRAKVAMGKAIAFGQSAVCALRPDEIVKTAISNYAFKNMEIAMYMSVISAAEAAGDKETLRVGEQILSEEQAMARCMLQHLDELTEEFLSRDAAGLEAKG